MGQISGIDVGESQSLQQLCRQAFPVAFVEDEGCSRRTRQFGREKNAKILKEAEHVAAPAAGYNGGAERVFKDEVPSDDPGDELAKSGISVGVSGTGDRNHRSKFGVAKAGEEAGHRSKNEGQENRRAGMMRRSRSGEDEDAGADDRAHADRNQVDWTESAAQRVFASFLGLVEDCAQRFCGKEIWHLILDFCSRSGISDSPVNAAEGFSCSQ